MSGRLPWMAGLIGAVVALVAFAPARWLAEPVGAATQGQLQLVNAQGTVWNGRADVLVGLERVRAQADATESGHGGSS